MFDCLLLMAGSGTRTSLAYNKVKYLINDKPIFEYSLDLFLNIKECNHVIMVVKEDEYDEFKKYENDRIKVVIGGATRFASVLNGANASTTDIILIHDAARPNIKEEYVINLYNSALKNKAVCLGVKVKDCIRSVSDTSYTLERNGLWQIQTPQAVDRKLLIQGLESNKFENYYDDCEVLEKNFGINSVVIEGDYNNIKVTTDEDFKYMEYIMNQKEVKYRIGHSKDTHRLVEGRRLVLGGVEIPFHLGLLGHSDADVVYHAIVESIIGALGMGDIGKLFPDTDLKYKDMNSSYFMKEIYKIMNEQGYEINNLDVTIYIEKPILKNYKPIMEENICSLLHTKLENVNVKATRGEGLGYIGNMEGISAEAVCMLIKK